MLKSKVSVLVGSLVWIFVLVYGTALLFRILLGSYLLEGGIINMNYGILAVLCAVPFVLNGLIESKGNSTNNRIWLSIGLFSVLFLLVHLILVFSAGTMQNEAIVRTLLVFPLSALFVVAAVYFAATNEKVS